MKQTLQANPGTQVNTAHKVSPQPASVIGDADLDKVSGGGGSPGGVLGDRARA